VSHEMNMIRRLSDKVLYLARGTVAGFGEPQSVTAQYLQDMGVLETSRKSIEGE
jgi:ABC-type polysaccharide/polyol phosphate transport system ATPase subunit